MDSLHELSQTEKDDLAYKMLTKTENLKAKEYKKVILKDHPFNLHSLIERPVQYMASSGSESSLRQMCYHISSDLLIFIGIEKDWLEKLRIIYAEYAPDSEKRHVYFEVATNSGYYMSGEMNNFSGEGSMCKERMEIIFDYLSRQTGVEIEKVEIDCFDHEDGIEIIRKMICP